MRRLAEPPAAIPVVSADNALTVAAWPTVQAVAPQRGGAQRYDLRPRLKPSKKDAFLVIVVLILLLPLAAGLSTKDGFVVIVVLILVQPLAAGFSRVASCWSSS